jgi:hypothetical protein
MDDWRGKAILLAATLGLMALHLYIVFVLGISVALPQT